MLHSRTDQMDFNLLCILSHLSFWISFGYFVSFQKDAEGGLGAHSDHRLQNRFRKFGV